MKRPDLNHLRRLVAWVQCEIGPSPEEQRAIMQGLAAQGIAPADDSARQRLVESYDKARSVPQYVRAAVKALDAYARAPGAVVDAPAREVRRVD